MIFKNECEAIAWLGRAGIHNLTTIDEGGEHLHRWTFSLPSVEYVSKPPPVMRATGAEAHRLNAERLKEHKPKTFLEAVNLLADRLLGGLKTDVKGSE